jgi:tetratricopeptide (TPR) repeat protein
MPRARPLLVAGLAIAAYLGLPPETALPVEGGAGACAAPAARESRRAADPGSSPSLPTGLQGRTERPIERPAAVDETDEGRDSLAPAASLNELATLYWTTGHHGAAEFLLKRAIAVDETTHGCDHPKLAVLLDSLAGLYQATGRHGAAEPLLERAVAIDMKAHGLDHPDLASRLNNLAVLYWATGRGDAAEPLFARALAILEKRLPPGHSVLAAIRENYVDLLVQLGRRRGHLPAADSGRGDPAAARGAAAGPAPSSGCQA